MNTAIKSVLIVAALFFSTLLAPTSASADHRGLHSGFGFNHHSQFDRRHNNQSLRKHAQPRRGYDNQFSRVHGDRLIGRFNKRSHRGFGHRGKRRYSRSKFGLDFRSDYSKRKRGFVFFNFN